MQYNLTNSLKLGFIEDQARDERLKVIVLEKPNKNTHVLWVEVDGVAFKEVLFNVEPRRVEDFFINLNKRIQNENKRH